MSKSVKIKESRLNLTPCYELAPKEARELVSIGITERGEIYFLCEDAGEYVIKFMQDGRLREIKISADENGYHFDYAGCLECGTCRALCGNTIIKKWEYPNGTFGVEYREG